MDRIESYTNYTNYTKGNSPSDKVHESHSESIFASNTKAEYKIDAKSEKNPLSSEVEYLQGKLKKSVPKLSKEFLTEIVRFSNEIKCSPEDLLAIMYHESNGWKASAYTKDKKGNSYGGLIQMNKQSLDLVKKKYAKELGLNPNITMSEYLKLPREKQIKYSEGYLKYMINYCKLNHNKKIKAGELWGMIKSPKLTIQKNSKFLDKLEKHINSIKENIFVHEKSLLDKY